jgi:hypothetical protein
MTCEAAIVLGGAIRQPNLQNSAASREISLRSHECGANIGILTMGIRSVNKIKVGPDERRARPTRRLGCARLRSFRMRMRMPVVVATCLDNRCNSCNEETREETGLHRSDSIHPFLKFLGDMNITVAMQASRQSLGHCSFQLNYFAGDFLEANRGASSSLFSLWPCLECDCQYGEILFSLLPLNDEL